MQTRRNANQIQPVLVPVAGTYDRKPRSLDREVTTIGRARGSDLCLEANEISTLHCLLYRTAEGYRLRDCNSRCGTRINGESIKTALMHDGDIINIGPFSFEFCMPAALFPNEGARPDPLQVEHWKASRRRLAVQALKLRKRLHGGSPREQESAQKGHVLMERIRCYDQRLRELQAAEEELGQERQLLADETENHRQHVQEVEKLLGERLDQADKDIHQRWQEFQQRCQAEEARMANSAPAQLPAPAAPPVADDHEQRERLRELEEQHQRRQAELESAQQKQREHLRELEEQYQRRQTELEGAHKEFAKMKDQWVSDQNQSSARLQEEQTALANSSAQLQEGQAALAKSSTRLQDEQAALAKTKADLVRMMKDLAKMQEALRKQPKPDVAAANAELERLRRENAALRTQLEGAVSVDEGQAVLEENEQLRARIQLFESNAGGTLSDALANRAHEDLQAEIELLREEVARKDKLLADSSKHDGAGGSKHDGAGADSLRAENALLKQLLEEKNKVVEELTLKSQQVPKTASDLERYEAELNEFRQQLEADRAKLKAEVETLRDRNKDLDDAIREMEMEMSKERADLARERMRLERVREEVKADTERLQRELAVRDSMAPVQKLRDELTQKQGPAAKSEKSLNDRLRGAPKK